MAHGGGGGNPVRRSVFCPAGAGVEFSIGDPEQHFIGGLETQVRVHLCSLPRRVEGDDANVAAACFGHALRDQFPRQAAATILRFDIHVEQVGAALSDWIEGMRGPIENQQACRGDRPLIVQSNPAEVLAGFDHPGGPRVGGPFYLVENRAVESPHGGEHGPSMSRNQRRIGRGRGACLEHEESIGRALTGHGHQAGNRRLASSPIGVQSTSRRGAMILWCALPICLSTRPSSARGCGLRWGSREARIRSPFCGPWLTGAGNWAWYCMPPTSTTDCGAPKPMPTGTFAMNWRRRWGCHFTTNGWTRAWRLRPIRQEGKRRRPSKKRRGGCDMGGFAR